MQFFLTSRGVLHRLGLVLAMACLSLWPSAWGFANAQVGSIIDNVEMQAMDGSSQHLLSNTTANVFLFFKPGQELTRPALKQLAQLQREMEGKPVHWVAIVSDRFARTNVEAEVNDLKLTMPVLVDKGDALYGSLGVILTPVIGITDKEHRLVAYEPFMKVNYTNVVRARIRHLLKEITDEELDAVLHPVPIQLNAEPEKAHRWLKLAERAFASTNYDKALENARKSLSHDTNAAAAHVLIGRVLAAQGDRGGALKSFDEALRIESTNAAALEGKKAAQ